MPAPPAVCWHEPYLRPDLAVSELYKQSLILSG